MSGGLKLGLIGCGIGYSLSPQIHSFIYKEWGIDAEYKLYDGADFNALIRETANLRGFNVTVPYKNEAGKLTGTGGAVNTVLRQGGGLKGYNTDGTGFLKALSHAGAELNRRKILLLGAGGAAEGILRALPEESEIRLINRTPEKAAGLIERVGKGALYSGAEGFKPQIIINCTAGGVNPLSGAGAAAVDLSALETLFDASYSPPVTAFLREAAPDSKALRLNGLLMLIYQAIAAAEIFTGTSLSEAAQSELAEKLLEQLNIKTEAEKNEKGINNKRT